MKSHFASHFLTLLTLLLFTLALAEPAPLGFSRQNSPQPQQQQQQPLRPNAQPLQSSNSFDSSSSSSSSSSASSDTKKKFSLSNIFGSSPAPFQCHRTPTTPVLNALKVFLQDLITRHRDDLSSPSSSSSEPFFKVCLGGHEEGDVRPSVVFKEMAKKQVEKLERIVRSQVLSKFPNLVVKRTGKGGLALVQEDGGKLKRRWTW
ncbi:MAG: hypothetical protein OHK93_006386 [Ramalina farinacea]|uniref:Uncharacterized protein n=1 Tax=Ramalina farinacea TaxID=258253 RepID=A0AA43QLY0_9LECA|nr:hypothetical protein [Ramalina farinacea]